MTTAVEDALPSRNRNPAITAAALGFLSLGAGFVVANTAIIEYMIRNRSYPVVFGIPLMGSSHTERLGIDFMIEAAMAFQFVCAIEALAGWWLWRSERRGGLLGLALLPVSLPFWILFELPLPFVIGLLRIIALARGWRSLR